MGRNWVNVSINRGHVFYQRLRTATHAKAYWNRVADKAEQEFASMYDALDAKYNWSTAADELSQIAKTERAKEKYMLKEIFGDSTNYDDNPYAYVKAINDAIGLLGDTKNLLSELNKYMLEVDKPGGMKSMAPGIFQHFEGYINSAITKQFTDKNIALLITNTWASGDDIALKILLRKQVEIALYNALQNTLDKNLKNTNLPMYPELSQALLKLTNDERDKLILRLYDKYNLNDVISNIEKHLKFNSGKIVLRSRGDKKEKYRNLSQSIARDSKFATLAGAFAEESITTLITALVRDNLKGLDIKASGLAITRDMSKTDAIATYTMSINIPDLTQIIDSALSDNYNNSLKESRRRLELALAGFKEIEGIVVYTNAKQYRLGKDFSSYGFSGGSATDIALYDKADASGTLTQIRNLLVNTLTDALFESEYSSVRELITRKLSAMIGNLLFDDWTMIGDEATGLRAIHVFLLDEIYLPLSFVCEQLANTIREALDKTTRWIRFKFYRPSKVLYPNPEDTTELVIMEGGTLLDAWEELRLASLRDNLFEFHFMSNFKDILKQIMLEYGVK